MTIRGNKVRSVAALAVASAAVLAGCSGGEGTSSQSSASSPTATGSPATPVVSASHSPTPSALPTAPPASSRPVPAGDAARASVVRVLATGCTTTQGADAAFVAPDRVVTAAAAVKDPMAIAVHADGGVVRGQLQSVDAASGLAVVRLLATGDGSRLTGPALRPAGAPATGSSVEALGHPVGKGLHRAPGKVLDAGHTDALAAPTVAGGPLLDGSGRLVGVVTGQDATGTSFAPAPVVAKVLTASASAPKTPKCQLEGPTMTSIHPDAAGIRQALGQWMTAVQQPPASDQLRQVMGPGLRQRYGSAEKYLASFTGAKPGAANVDNLEMRDATTDTLVWTVQMEGPGQACAVRHQRLVMDSSLNRWTIDRVDELGTTACS